LTCHINFRAATATADGRRFDLAPLGVAAQELVLVGGLEALVRTKLPART
jgi:hypothetical protein